MMTYSNKAVTDRRSEQGNVLFLILIAVALFAALSYAVTQSTRSGGGDAGRETSLVNSAQITQYPASVKTAITRMIISLNHAPAELEFNAPSDFANLDSVTQGVFHPSGGGATYSLAPNSVMTSGTPGTWHFNGNNEIVGIGTDATTADIIAFLPGVSQQICERIHTQLGLGAVPDLTADSIDYTADMVGTSTGAPVDPLATAGIVQITDAVLDGQPQGCFLGAANTYVYFHVLVEN